MLKLRNIFAADEVMTDCLTLDLVRFAPIRNLAQHEAPQPITELQGRSTNQRLASVNYIFLLFLEIYLSESVNCILYSQAETC